MKKLLSVVLSIVVLVSVFCVQVVPAFADVYRPSVEQKVKPDVVEIEVEIEEGQPGYGEKIIAQIVDTPGEEEVIEDNIAEQWIIVTSYAEAQEEAEEGSKEEEIQLRLVEAFDDIQNVQKSLSELNEDLETIAKSIDETYDARVFVASDLFDIDLSDNYMEKLKNDEDFFLRIKFNLNFKSGDVKPIVMHKVGNDWVIVEDSHVYFDDNYYLCVEFKDLCPVAILKVDPERMEEPVSTGCNCANLYWIWIVVLAVLVCTTFIVVRIVSKKDKKEQTEDNNENSKN